MKALGWNCQGMGKNLGSPKMNHLARMVCATKPQVTFVSEIKSSKVNSSNLISRFNMSDALVVPSRCRSGGLWLMWSDDLKLNVHSSSFHVILATATLVSSNQHFGLICIYGDPYHRQTRTIWDQIAAFVYDNCNLPMLCMGDMNELLYDVDKNSLNINVPRMNAFKSLVKNCGLFDLGFSGPAYTWTNKRFSSKPVYERIDRCLVNSDWCHAFPVSNVYNMPIIHSISDHAAILLSTDGPVKKFRRSFKFENWWLKESDFQDYARNAWNSSKNKSFSNRTKHLAGTLKFWCRKKKPLQDELANLEEQIKEIQMRPVEEQDHNKEDLLATRYEQTLTKLTESYMQRAKKHWIKDGDRNTAFFHKAIIKRRKRNSIASIKDENNIVQHMPDKISNTFISYFKSIFSSANANNGRPFLSTHMPQDSDEYTYTIPDEEEVLSTIKEMRRNASPGPDGFNVEFYIATWEWIGKDVTDLVRNFFQTGIMPTHINDTHIALIPKKLVPLVPADYRPISLCNVIYKIIAKCIANRLKSHLPDYIHPAQQAFIEGRRISNNIIIAQEITHSFALKAWEEKAFMLKIDLAKAFDRLEWNFIVAALNRKGLHPHFINLIHACISTPKYAVIINGQAFANFKGDRGIRQGCPLSPYLFVLAINELSIALQEAMEANHFAGIKLGPSCPSIHSLLFADDLLVCGQATQQEAVRMKRIIQSFCNLSGQTPNWSKSGIIFSKNVDLSIVHMIKQIFNVPDIDNNFIHLGHPLIIPGKKRNDAYNFVLEKFKLKLSTYKADHLSHAARLELIKAVFSSIPVYYMSNILFTKSFIRKIRSIIRNFWWTGIRGETNSKSLCLKAWKDICCPKNEGGLGIRNLQAMNQGLLLMTAWRLADNQDSFLYSVLKSKYFPDASIWRPNVNTPKSAFWSSILKILPILKVHSFYQICNGDISIWSSPWCNGWENIYDALILQEGNFSYPAQVKDLWMPNRKEWNINLIDMLFQEPMASFIKQTQVLSLQDKDILCWKLTPAGKCNTKSAYKACLQKLHENGEPMPSQVSTQTTHLLKLIWKNKNITPRVQTFGWRLLRKAMPTGARAGKISKHINKLCCRCGAEENDIHLFFLCFHARAAWFSNPWYIKIDQVLQNRNSISQIILNLLNMHHPYGSLQNILTFLWCIWKARNNYLFNKKETHPMKIIYMANAINQSLEMSSVVQDSFQGSNSKENQGHGMQGENQEIHSIKQGHTLKTDLIIKGSKIYSDAAWKTKKVPGALGTILTGIGIFCHLQRNNGEEKILIQASTTSKAHSPLHAESAGLLLAVNIAERLQVQQVTFLTDNLTLAKAAAATTILDKEVPWELRKQISDYHKASRNLGGEIFHIKRDLNGIAHDCAKQAIRQDMSLPIFNCSNSAHLRLGNCPVASAISSSTFSGIVLQAVHCL